MGVNVYDVINSRIMELLEQGTIPWKKPWNAQNNYPKNLISGKMRNPFFLDRVSGFDWTVIPVLSGQRFFYFLPAVVVV